MATATFAAGCFWGVEHAFRQVDGVIETMVGYSGGTVARPTYEQVCGGATGHAEVVKVSYDPDTVGYEALVELFFDLHDPTQLDRQGPDIGSQYRSVIFTHDDDQDRLARAGLRAAQASGRHRAPIVTVIQRAEDFWPAEDYHQQYFEKRGQPRWLNLFGAPG